LVVVALLWMSTAAWSYTRDDVKKAREQHDNALLKKITDDSSVPVELRIYALGGLPRDVQVTYLDVDWIKNQPNQQFMLLLLAAQYFDLSTERYPEAFKLLADVAPARNRYVYYCTLQRAYVRRLGAEGKWSEALAESKRIIGLTPPQQNYSASALQTINITIKGENYARTKDVTASLKAMQEFMDDAKNGTHKSAWFNVPYPGKTPNSAYVSPLEKSKNVELRIWALLYAGKYELARHDADALYAKATTPDSIKKP